MDATPQAGPPERRRRGRLRSLIGGVPEGVQEIELRDGSRVWVRPIQPDDRERIVQGLSWMSDRSRYLRFHSSMTHLTSSQLNYLVDVDHHDHEALVAVAPDVDGQPGVAVARYIRLREDPRVAEAAITVVDDYQGLGIGTALIGMLERLANERGIATFRNYVLAENEAMLEIFRQLDGDLIREAPGLYRVDVPVPGADDDQPDTPAGRWVASVGRGTPNRADTWAYPFVWLVRKVTGSEGTAEADEPGGLSRLLKRFTEDSEDGPDDAGPPPLTTP